MKYFRHFIIYIKIKGAVNRDSTTVRERGTDITERIVGKEKSTSEEISIKDTI